MEYFVSVGDDLWEMDDDALITLATQELEALRLVSPGVVEEGYVVRYPKTYPVYDGAYAEALQVIRHFLESEWPNIHPVGRNGMHRYNNQDHSMLTAMLTADDIALGTSHDVWSVNVEEAYHEETATPTGTTGTGRSAPTLA